MDFRGQLVGHATQAVPRIFEADSALQHRPLRSRLGQLLGLQRDLRPGKATSCDLLLFTTRSSSGAMVNNTYLPTRFRVL